MRVGSILGRLTALSLGLLLLSCGATRYSVPGPTSARDLGRYVLIIERAPDGQVAHSWKPVKDFDLTAYPHPAATRDLHERIVHVAFDRNCDEERDACEDMCVSSLKGDDWSHMSAGAKKRHCIRVCMQPYLDCSRLKELAEGGTVEFHAIDQAIDWVKQNREKLMVGTVVVIAGVAFVVVTGGSGGFLLLAPVIVLASYEAAAEPRALAVQP
jgi:intracellular sulfur oxidation DsrE/DsrF family protein